MKLKKRFERESFLENNKSVIKSGEELIFAELFVKSYERDQRGRFIVLLPVEKEAETILCKEKCN